MPRNRRALAADGPREVLTAREAAKYLRLALPTFYRYMWQGKIPSSKIGGRYRKLGFEVTFEAEVWEATLP